MQISGYTYVISAVLNQAVSRLQRNALLLHYSWGERTKRLVNERGNAVQFPKVFNLATSTCACDDMGITAKPAKFLASQTLLVAECCWQLAGESDVTASIFERI